MRTILITHLLASVLVGCPTSEPIATDSGVAPPEDTGPDIEMVDTADTASTDTGPEPLVCPEATGAELDVAGLGIRITSPTGLGSAYASGNIAIGGVLLGKATALRWRLGETSGEIPLAASWQTEPIPLSAGDNRIVVEATGSNGEVVSDAISVLSSSAPLAGIRLDLTPDHAWLGETRHLRAALALPALASTTVTLLRVTPSGAQIPGTAFPMVDDGSGCGFAEACDETEGDRIYSACFTVTPTEVGSLCFRAELALPAGPVRGPVTCLDVRQRPDSGACNVVTAAIAAAQAAFDGAGGGPAGLDAALATLKAVDAYGGVVASGRALLDHGVWVRFADGPRVALPLGVPEGTRGRPAGARGALLLGDGGELTVAEGAFRADRCPPLERSGPHRKSAFTLDRAASMTENGVVTVAAHGGVFFEGDGSAAPRYIGGDEVIFTGQPIECAAFLPEALACSDKAPCPAGSTCHAVPGSAECVSDVSADVMAGRVVFGPGVYGMTSTFIDHIGARRPFPASIVYVGACHSASTGSLALAVLGAGAASYLGYDGLVTDAFATEMGQRLFPTLGDGTRTVDGAACYARDPDTGATFRRFGNGDADLSNAEIVSADFETGTSGWRRTGDARPIARFCGQGALEGKTMALLSTGIGFGGNTSTLEQTFCIPPGTASLRFRWRYLSAELEDFCGTGKGAIQDRIELEFTRPNGSSVQVKRCDVDDICLYDVGGCVPKPCAPPSTACGCGDCYEPYEPVDDCDFCGQPIQATSVVEETFNVSALAGTGPVTLKARVRDSGDGVNDTVLLLDSFRFE